MNETKWRLYWSLRRTVDPGPTWDLDVPLQVDLRRPNLSSHTSSLVTNSKESPEFAAHWMMVAVSMENSRSKCLKRVAFKLWHRRNQLRNLLNNGSLRPTPSFWFGPSGLSLSICISKVCKPGQCCQSESTSRTCCARMSVREALGCEGKTYMAPGVDTIYIQQEKIQFSRPPPGIVALNHGSVLKSTGEIF